MVKIFRVRYLGAQPLEVLQCVAQTRRRHRCPHHVLAPTAPTGTWVLAPKDLTHGQLALPGVTFAVYQHGGAPQKWGNELSGP